MKNICLISLLLCLCLEATEAQIIVKERRAVQVLPPQTFYLNSTARASFGGKSKMGVNFVLPPGTVEWYFSFTTARGEKPRTSVELFSQLTKLIDPTGMTAIATNAIFTLPGAGACDILVMDKANAEIFLDKNTSSYGSFDYDLASARENFQNGTVKLDNITKGEWTIGIRNRNTTEGVTVSIEVVAIVEEMKVVQKSFATTKAEIFASLARKAYIKEDYDESLQLYRRALSYDPNMVSANTNIGLIYLIYGDYEAAIESYSTAIALGAKEKSNLWLNEAIDDLKSLIEKQSDLHGAAEILELFLGEQGKTRTEAE